MKRCAKCGVEKPLGEFHKRARSPDGLRARCKPCHVADAGVWQKRNPEKRKTIVRAWQKRNPEKFKAGKDAWRGANPEKVIAQGRRWRRDNIEKARAKVAKWQVANREKASAASSAWAKAHPEKVTAYCAKRRADKLRATPAWACMVAIAAVYAEAKRVGATVDHVVPLRSALVCGLHVGANLKVISKAENSAKGNRYWPDMP